jgi:thymidylate synthase
VFLLIYNNHFEQVVEQLKREPLPLPRLSINKDVKDINEFKMSDFELVGYESHSAIKAEMAV